MYARPWARCRRRYSRLFATSGHTVAGRSNKHKALGARFFGWHRWLGWIVGLQLLAWVVGGLVFSWVPFKAWVKAEDRVHRTAQILPANWADVAAAYLRSHATAPVLSVTSVATARGPALRLKHADADTWVSLEGTALQEPGSAEIERFARSLYSGLGRQVEVTRMDTVPARALIVREAGDRSGLWRASFDDGIGTRLYFDARSGELLAVRNDAWVLYDFFWRLHLMDYSGGEDFSHPLIKVATLLAAATVVTGVVLAALALRRTYRRRARKG